LSLCEKKRQIGMKLIEPSLVTQKSTEITDR
jgi:hypothetical protein